MPKPFRSCVNLLWGKCLNFRLTHPPISLWITYFMHLPHWGDRGVLAAVDTYAEGKKKITSSWCLQHSMRPSQYKMQLPSLCSRFTASSLTKHQGWCCTCTRGARTGRFSYSEQSSHAYIPLWGPGSDQNRFFSCLLLSAADAVTRNAKRKLCISPAETQTSNEFILNCVSKTRQR